jgi:dTDP-4-dehydrorhamnose reductase
VKVLITGAGGMVGRTVAEHCVRLGDEVFAHERASLDIADEYAVAATFERARPDTVINCAAWTDVDGCELDPARAHLVNAEAVGVLARGARGVGASLVTISTDYVFDGAREGFYTQRDDPDPKSVYGVAKLRGERLAQAETARCVVVRTGWIFGAGGRNFLSRVPELLRGGDSLKAISDSWGTPTYAPHLAARLRELAALDLPGTYHVVNAGEGASFEDFARASARLARVGGEVNASQIEVVSMDSLKRPAPRPRNSRLRCLLSPAIGLKPLPDWLDALSEFVRAQSQD